MIYTTTETVPGRDIEAVLGVVNGNVVQSKHVAGTSWRAYKASLVVNLKVIPRC